MSYSLSHLADHVLLHDLAALVRQDRTTTAALLAHLAEVDERRLYLPAAYPSMFAFCLGELRMSEDVAAKRIHSARAARRFPAILAAVAEGRLHLSGVVMLAPHLTPENAGELLAAATHQSKSEIELLLARRFPRPDIGFRLEPVAPRPTPEPVPATGPAPGSPEHALGHVPVAVTQHAPGHVEHRARVEPLSPERFALKLTIGQGTHDKLQRAQNLLSHQVSSADLAQVLDRALDALIEKLEKRRFAATDKPRPAQRPKPGSRHIPADVRRRVRERDGDQCTFVGDRGHRCQERRFLEFDHEIPVARGGKTTARNLRLRCRAHNQHAADRVFGPGFMNRKRRAADERPGAAIGP